MQTIIPILVALISASTILIGYFFQKRKEREFEINKTRQEIYTRFVKNLTAKLEFIDRLKDDADMPDRMTVENSLEIRALIRRKYPELDIKINESVEIGTLMALYASDDAVKACADYYRDSWSSMQTNSTVKPDKDRLLLQLRNSLFPNTIVSQEDIEFITVR